MENLFLYELVDAVKGEFLLGDPHYPVETISIDTRTMHKGDYFFALRGENYDGHSFLQSAVRKGVKGVVVSQPHIDLGKPFPYVPAIVRVPDTIKALGDLARFYRKRYQIPIVAITGSNGKTTVKEMLASILRKKGPTLSTVGNYNNTIGLPLTLYNLNMKHMFAVLEVGTNIQREIKQLADIACPDIGVITNIGFSHLQSFKNLEGVLTEKRSLLESISSNGWSVINNDDPYLAPLARSLASKIVTFGLNKNAQIYAEKLKLWPGRPTFKLHCEKEIIDIELPVYGQFNVYNALAAVAAAWALSIPLDLIKKGLESFSEPKMRMNVMNTISGATIINDAYNANPSSMRESIKTVVQSFPDRNKIVVLGDMLELGEAEKKEHLLLGEFLASQPLVKVFLYGPLMESTFLAMNSDSVQYFTDKDDLKVALHTVADSREVVMFKASRGMQFEELVDELFPTHDV